MSRLGHMLPKNNEVQYHTKVKHGDIGKYVLMPGDPGRVPMIAQYLANAYEVACNREFRTMTGFNDDIKVSVTSTGIGGPSASIAVEELIQAGAEVFIRIGTAGSLQRTVQMGDLVISTGSVRDEGTTRQYVPLSYPAIADLDVTFALRMAAQKLGLAHHCGITHSKDAFFMESTPDSEPVPLHEYNQMQWNIWERSHVLATAMEGAAIFVVSSLRQVQAGEILTIVGLTYEDTPIVPGISSDNAIKVALEAIKILENTKQ